ncbi:unnamed protein product [Heligmosomoides polygyrus]|uniref:Uncharacterized protein n=1 Tax=Heligmosomoides polygyrus TaxID=6339 RepID=A0A183G6T4_HELPZ|nr:unnamed protein product [Heligmosomoides polygyrus]
MVVDVFDSTREAFVEKSDVGRWYTSMHKRVQNGVDFHRVERFPIIQEDKDKWDVVFAAPLDELRGSLKMVEAGEILANPACSTG